MQTSIIKRSAIVKYKSFDAVFFVRKKQVEEDYNKFFQNKKKKKFLDVVSIKLPQKIKKEDLIFSNRGIKFNLEISQENKENKARFMIFELKDKNYTKEFILWFFSQKEIQEFLSLFAQGNIIIHLPRKAFDYLEIIYPQEYQQDSTSVNISSNSEFKKIIKIYFKEYQNNLEQENFLSASFLAGSICESILYQFLLDNKVKKKLLERKMFGELLEIIEIMNLKIENKEDFKKIKNFRNLIHPKNALKNQDKIYNLEKEIKPTFNKIIKNFGI